MSARANKLVSMLTLLLYVLFVGLTAAVLFLIASALFGRGEELGPLPEGTTATVLPAEGISGADVRALRFQQVTRGYKAGEVDWALSRLAARIDELQWELAHVRGAVGAGVPRGTSPFPAQPEPQFPAQTEARFPAQPAPPRTVRQSADPETPSPLAGLTGGFPVAAGPDESGTPAHGATDDSGAPNSGPSPETPR